MLFCLFTELTSLVQIFCVCVMLHHLICEVGLLIIARHYFLQERGSGAQTHLAGAHIWQVLRFTSCDP